MNLFLDRLFDVGGGRYGRLAFPGHPTTLWTMERAWQGNEPFVSCVPCGTYGLSPHTSTRHGETWALVGGSVSHFEAEAATRFLILFHAASFPSDLQGCIAPGLSIASHGPTLGDSREAMDVLRGMLRPDESHTLTIGGPYG